MEFNEDISQELSLITAEKKNEKIGENYTASYTRYTKYVILKITPSLIFFIGNSYEFQRYEKT